MNPKRRSKILAVPLLLVLSVLMGRTGYCSDTQSYCHDRESWREWNALARAYPNDPDIQTLCTLRKRLCAEIGKGDITVEEAVNIFDEYWTACIEKKAAERNNLTGKPEP